MKKRVLILCTGNSIRSQMAEGIWRDLAGDEWEVDSAGSHPSGVVHPKAVRVMAERGIDLGDAESKGVDRFLDREYDLVITVCASAREHCPVFPGAKRTLHWPFPDPVGFHAGEEEALAEFRKVRDAIEERIRTYLETGE